MADGLGKPLRWIRGPLAWRQGAKAVHDGIMGQVCIMMLVEDRQGIDENAI